MVGEEIQGGDINGGVMDETPPSPKSRVKFLCSHGGRILPRPIDGQLKYVGGETRVIAVPRDITFSELMKKLTPQFDKEMVLKYQVIPEDLDALVSVRSDDDIKHMLEEYDRHEIEGTPRLRAFLFPSNPIIVENQAAAVITEPPHALEQRYVDAINGITRTTFGRPKLTYSISSACASPHSSSPNAQNVDNSISNETIFTNGYLQSSRVPPLQKVQSSPSLCSLNSFQHQGNSSVGNHYFYQYYQSHKHHHLPHGYHSRPPLDPHKGVDMGRCVMGYGGLIHYHPSSRPQRDQSGSAGCGYCDECGVYVCGGFDRSGTGSLPRSPRKATWE
ncbi:hypothetical protein FH972_004481 [Carpinus fangiana]|uniref:PB1 domain-containing protein n=1 Tax=Carpinus fangiana TaxID=176857 RepID=A0A5N6QLP3_9ROSI|nr:hypothetical protein FH972_004481 [Carpinus fangiana]